MKLGYHSITWGGVVGDSVGVTSVKNLHYRSNGSLETAFAAIASLGYQGVEIFDGNLMDHADQPERLRGLLDDSGLELVGVYTGANFVYDEIRPDEMYKIRAVIDVAARVGASSLVVGGGAQRPGPTPDSDLSRLAGALDEVDELAREHGLQACYHPHLTTIVEGPADLERLFSRTGIGFCPDTAHLAAGGGDPAELIRRYGDRVHHVHLKDAVLSPLAFTPLGEGDLDFEGILSAVHEVGYDGWLMVELDSYDGDPAVAAEISKRYLDGLLARRT